MVRVRERRTKGDWAYFLEEIAEKYESAEKITLVMDNLNTHTLRSLYETFQPEKAKELWERFEFVYAPKHGSWLNIAEIELNVLTGQCLKTRKGRVPRTLVRGNLHRRIDDIGIVERESLAWQKYRNNKGAKVNWQFTTDDARIKL